MFSISLASGCHGSHSSLSKTAYPGDSSTFFDYFSVIALRFSNALHIVTSSGANHSKGEDTD